MRKTILFPLLIILSLFIIPASTQTHETNDGNITFQPNIIPELTISFVEEFFRFKWKNNRFDLKLLVGYNDVKQGMIELTLKDFWEKTNRVVKWKEIINKATDSMREFGYTVTDIPLEMTNNVEHLIWRIESASFDVSQIEVEMIDPPEEPYTITRFHLPDNLVLSYEDLWLYDFTVTHPNKLETKVEGVKGKTAWYLDPITFSSPTITVIGGTSGSPLDFKDVWDADQTGGWNVFHNHRNNNTQFQSDAKLVFGNGTVAGTTWFNDTAKQITFHDILTANYQIFMKREAHATVTFGTLENATLKSTSGGVQFVILQDSYQVYVITGISSSGSTNLYSCDFIRPTILNTWLVVGNGRMYNTILTKNLMVLGRSDTDYFNVYVGKTTNGIWSLTGTWDRVEIFDCATAFFVQYVPVTMNNLYARGCTNIARSKNIADNVYLINADSDVWTFTWTGSSAGEIYRQYTFDLTMYFQNGTQIQNANVTISNDYLGSSDSWLTFANGSISPQTYSYGHYNQTGDDTIYDYNPYNLTVTLDGYETYTSLLNVTKKMALSIALTPSPQVEEEPRAGAGAFKPSPLILIERELGTPFWRLWLLGEITPNGIIASILLILIFLLGLWTLKELRRKRKLKIAKIKFP